MAKQDWMREGLCTSLSPEEADDIFFIGPGKSSKRARLFCAGCPVKRDCGNYALTYDEQGIWAGNTEDDRKCLDVFIRDTLRATAEAEGKLESRNLNDFIPQVRRQNNEAQELAARASERLDDALLASERLAAQLEALDPLFEPTTFPQAFDL